MNCKIVVEIKLLKKCNQILRKRLKHDYNINESVSPDPKTRSTSSTIDSG